MSVPFGPMRAALAGAAVRVRPAVDPGAGWLSRRTAVLTLLSIECGLGWLGAAYILLRPTPGALTGTAYLVLAPIITALLVAYWRGWDAARFVLIVAHILVIGGVAPLPTDGFPYIPQAAIIPSAVALLVAGPAWVLGSAVGTIAIILVRAGGFAEYLGPQQLLSVAVTTVCLVVSRLIMDAALRESEARALQAERAQREIGQQADELRRQQSSNQFQASLLRGVGQPIIATDATGRVTYWNGAAEEQLGWCADELLGHRMTDVEPPPFDLPADDAWWARVVREEARVLDFTGRRRDGTTFPVSVSSWPLRNPDGSPLGRVAVITDLTDRREAERQREQLERGQRLRALGQMAGGIAHDLNQALAVVTGYTELALDDLRGMAVRADTRSHLETTIQAAMQGADSVKRLLTFTRQQAQDPPETVDVGQVVQEVVHFTAPQWRDRAQAESRPITLDLHVESSLLIRGWISSLREALMNLILNAVDAMPTGGSIRVDTHRDGGTIVVNVADTGLGMPPDVQARIFEPFFTTKGEHGTGLGLAMVSGIVERHGGEIAVTSAEGQGTRFCLRFPSAAVDGPAAHPGDPAATVLPARVLVVDDEPRLARMLSAMLARDGHDVEMAPSGEAAIAYLECGGYDLVISDVSMGPGMNGWKLAEQVARRWPETRFILASGWGSGIDESEATRRAVDAVMAKPYRLNEVRQLVARLTA